MLIFYKKKWFILPVVIVSIILLFLNSDTKIGKSDISLLASYADSHADVGIVGGKLLNTDGTIQRSYGAFYTLPTVFMTLLLGDKGELLRMKQLLCIER